MSSVLEAVKAFRGNYPKRYSVGFIFGGERMLRCGFNRKVEECSHHAGIELFNEYVKADKKLLEKESKVDYTSEEFWEDAPKGSTLWDPQCHVWCDDNGYWPEGSYSYRKAVQAGLGTGRYIHRPKPQPLFTKAMQGAGELPCIGMEVSFDRMIVTIVGYTLKGMPVFEMPNGMVDSFNSNNSYRPIDTRSDREKAIDYMKYAYAKGESMEDVFTEITKGYVNGVTWSGNNDN